MKRILSLSLAISAALIIAGPFSACAQESTSEKYNYVSINGGLFIPTGDLSEFDNGFYTSVMYNRYLSKYAAVEAGIGFYTVKEDAVGVSAALGSSTRENKVMVIPATVNLKGILPFPDGEIYVGAGIGCYFARTEVDVSSTSLGSFSADNNEAVFGGQIKAGVIINLSETIFLGVEGMYVVTDNTDFIADFSGVPIRVDTDLDGFSVSGVFGFRF